MRAVLLALSVLALTAGPASATGTLTIDGSGTGTVTGDGISCTIANGAESGDCTETYTDEQDCDPARKPPCFTIPASFSVTASPASDFAFSQWSTGQCSGQTDPTCASQISSNQTARPVFVDATDPVVAFSGQTPAAGAESRANQGFIITASDNVGVVQTRWLLQQAGFPDVEIPFGGPTYAVAFTSTLQNRPSGTSFTVLAQARDAAGRIGQATRTFVLDNTTGGSFVGASPAENATTKADPVTIEFVHDADVVNVQCQVDAGGYAPCASPYTPSLPDGAHAVEVRLQDDAGNVASIARTFKVDRTAPTLTVTGPAGAVNETAVTASYSAEDTVGPAPVVDCALDGGAYGTCTGIAVTEGPHTLRVRARDTVENTRTADTAFTVDRTLPELTVSATPGAGSVKVDWTASDATALSFTCQVDGGAFAPCTSGQVLSGLAVGAHTVAVRAQDAAGNARSQSRSFTVAAASGGTGGGGDGTGGGGPGGGGTTLPTRPKLTAPRSLSLTKAKRKLRVTAVTTRAGCRFRILHNGKPVASRKVLKSGTSRLVVTFARSVRPGRYVLTLKCGAKTVKRGLKLTR
jgi:hypothetical protein